MRALTPAEVLFDGEAPPALLPACDHYAGSEKLMLKSLALQQQLGAAFDVTLDCEDGAQAGHEARHAELVASLLDGGSGAEDHGNHASANARARGRIGVRIHDFAHPHWRDDVRLILRAARRPPAYITLPKIASVPDAAEMCAFIEGTRRELGIARPIPVQLLIETHGALAQVFELAALPGVEALSFGLMDFVSAHHGAIPASAMRSPGQFEHPLVARAKLNLAAACHAHGKTPSHNVTTEVRDMDVVARDAEHARDAFGYTRMWSIHPAQVPIIVAAFAPRDTEITLAADILLAAQAAQWGPIRHGDILHDRASYRYYWSVLRRAQAAGRPLPDATTPFFTTVNLSEPSTS
ncbi:HpcH/HpaI aldolase/citrate lyase family protein [Paraburkholderia hayleyella]|uniref:HpcH/HpaI aldolase/citrate lyase family protein n=1 Tax=Paraburkholderia hayleyella TaxID=2152889 RepID=UPI00129268F9|nr:aldolase/citrate lyase family protein [Paraburkholderia hayleyella]